MKEAGKGHSQAPEPPAAKDPALLWKGPTSGPFQLANPWVGLHCNSEQVCEIRDSPILPRKDSGSTEDVEFQVAGSGQAVLFSIKPLKLRFQCNAVPSPNP